MKGQDISSEILHGYDSIVRRIMAPAKQLVGCEAAPGASEDLGMVFFD